MQPAGLLNEATAGRRQIPERWRAHPGGVRCNEGLSADAQTVVKELWSEISIVGPVDRPKLRMHCCQLEKIDVSKRFENFAPEVLGEVDLALAAVVEPDPEE